MGHQVLKYVLVQELIHHFFPTVSILSLTTRFTSSGVPNGIVVCVPIVPQNDNLSPYCFLIGQDSYIQAE